MGMGIGGFYKQAVARDFSRDFQMRVVRIGPGVLNENDNVFITSANLPGYAIHNHEVPFMGLGFNVPGSGHFPGSAGWAVTFRSDQQLNIREKLVTWQQSVFNAFPDSAGESTGAYGPKYTESVADLTIFDRDGNEVRAMRLIGIYPVEIAALDYNTTGNGAVVEFAATLAYQWWEPQAIGSVIP